VVAPLLFGRQVGDPAQLGRALLAAVSFSLLASSVYLINDLLDREADRHHPTKRLRPIASGELSVAKAVVLAALLLLLAFASALLFLNPAASTLAAAYLLINLAYSAALKRVAGLDVLLVASGFVLRVLFGALALQISPSPWLLACTASLATFLALAKRRGERARVERSGAEGRDSLRHYRLKTVDRLLAGLALATTLSYLAYTVSPHTIEYVGDLRLLGTSPFVALGVLRYLSLVRAGDAVEDPTSLALRDPYLVGITVSWTLVCALALYL